VALPESDPVAVATFRGLAAVRDVTDGDHPLTVNGADVAPHSELVSTSGEGATPLAGVDGKIPLVARENAVKLDVDRPGLRFRTLARRRPTILGGGVVFNRGEREARSVQQYVFYGGKGGVGKTTCAAATGVAFADRGEQTLVVSTDPAHSLADAFDVDPATDGAPRTVAEDLAIVEVGPEAGERTFRTVVDAVASELRAAGIRLEDDEIERLFTAGVAPGSDELAALELLAEHLDAGTYDRVVVDTAPTGHTLRLLDLPEVVRETLSATSSLRGQVRSLVDRARGAVFGPAYYAFGRGEDEDAETLSALADRMTAVRDLLRDPDRATFRVVTTPEPMAVAETERFVDDLRADDVPVDTLVVNRVLRDPEVDCERCRTRARAHEQQLDALQGAFPDLRVVELPELSADVAAGDALAALAPSLTSPDADRDAR
jgi:arsenite-transporting ATPase